jgi:hypothetical protein
VRCQTAEKFGSFGHIAHVGLKESNALLERRKLLKELFFSELPVQETALVVVSADKIHDDTPS